MLKQTHDQIIRANYVTCLTGGTMIRPIQRKTTLKWRANGELSSVDMARILEALANKELTQCSLACDANEKSNEILFHVKEP